MAVALGRYGSPWPSAEVLLLAVVATSRSRVDVAIAVITMASGQITGKSIMNWGSRRSQHFGSLHVVGRLEHRRTRIADRPTLALALMFVSSTFDVHPAHRPMARLDAESLSL